MRSDLPEPLRVLTEQLSRLPGLGPKSALRVAMTLLKWPETETRRLGQGIAGLRDTLCLCSRCGSLTAEDPCPICTDPYRTASLLCVVPEWDSMLAMEKGAFYQGLYFVLGGLLEGTTQSDAQGLDTGKLLSRLAEGEVKEVILALGSTLEAENTASYLKTILSRKFPDVKITRLAQGIPLGAEVKFMDHETLRQSLKYRQEL